MRTGELADLVRTEIKRRGGVIDRERLNRHFIIYWSVGAHKFTTVIAKSGRAPRAIDNALADIRRHVRERSVA